MFYYIRWLYKNYVKKNLKSTGKKYTPKLPFYNPVNPYNEWMTLSIYWPEALPDTTQFAADVFSFHSKRETSTAT